MATTLTLTNVRFRDTAGIRQRRVVTVTGPASYATGGMTIAPADVSLGTIESVGGVGGFLAWSGTAVRLVVYDRTNGKFVWYVPNTGAEVAAAQDLSTFSANVELIGY